MPRSPCMVTHQIGINECVLHGQFVWLYPTYTVHIDYEKHHTSRQNSPLLGSQPKMHSNSGGHAQGFGMFQSRWHGPTVSTSHKPCQNNVVIGRGLERAISNLNLSLKCAPTAQFLFSVLNRTSHCTCSYNDKLRRVGWLHHRPFKECSMVKVNLEPYDMVSLKSATLIWDVKPQQSINQSIDTCRPCAGKNILHSDCTS